MPASVASDTRQELVVDSIEVVAGSPAAGELRTRLGRATSLRSSPVRAHTSSSPSHMIRLEFGIVMLCLGKSI